MSSIPFSTIKIVKSLFFQTVKDPWAVLMKRHADEMILTVAVLFF